MTDLSIRSKGGCSMRTGILGGTFDPIHRGHVEAAKAALEALSLDRVLVLPSGQPPYKRCHAGRQARLDMVKLACDGEKGLVPCDIEIKRDGESYTVDTLKALRRLYPEDEFTYIIGADALNSLPKWRGLDEIAQMTSFAVLSRPGWDRQSAEAQAALPGVNVTFTDIEGLPISSGMARTRVAAGEDVSELVGKDVAEYIRSHGLYLCDYTEPEILEKLKKALTVHRYYHTLGVADTAERLSERFGVDSHRARLAGLLHDCAKSMPYGEMRRIVSENVSDTDEQELDSEPVLHAPAGMVVARRDYGVRDRAILQAIRRHTLGGEDMTAMDALIYVSDFIEPGRRPFPGLEDVRALAEVDIFAAMRACARLTTDYVTSRGQRSHPKTMALL